MIGAGIIGFIGGRVAPDKFRTGGGHGAGDKHYGAAIIDDDHPTPKHALFSWRKLALVCVAGLVLWGGVIGALTALYGWESTLTQMGWFFTKAALLTFGGAYAVLPYVNEGAVETYQWLTPTQMIDGLALGETTPGPLIMVVAFVGFVGGWTKEIFGPDSLFAAGATAATVVTYFTFLPSFLLHSDRRAAHRDDARRDQADRAAHRDYRGCGRRHSESRPCSSPITCCGPPGRWQI